MKERNVLLAGTAAGVVLGGLTWLLVRKAREEVGPVEALASGEQFPRITGTTLAGEVVTLPDAITGKVGLLVVAFDYVARRQVEEWANYVAMRFGDEPQVAFYQVPMISGVGPVMRKVIDRGMLRGTPERERSRVLTVYGDLRELRKRLGEVGKREAHVFLLGRTGRIAWKADGPPTADRLTELDTAMIEQGIVSEPPPTAF